MGRPPGSGTQESDQPLTPSDVRDPTRHHSSDPICAALYAETMNSPPPSASGSLRNVQYVTWTNTLPKKLLSTLKPTNMKSLEVTKFASRDTKEMKMTLGN